MWLHGGEKCRNSLEDTPLCVCVCVCVCLCVCVLGVAAPCMCERVSNWISVSSFASCFNPQDRCLWEWYQEGKGSEGPLTKIPINWRQLNKMISWCVVRYTQAQTCLVGTVGTIDLIACPRYVKQVCLVTSCVVDVCLCTVYACACVLDCVGDGVCMSLLWVSSTSGAVWSMGQTGACLLDSPSWVMTPLIVSLTCACRVFHLSLHYIHAPKQTWDSLELRFPSTPWWNQWYVSESVLHPSPTTNCKNL